MLAAARSNTRRSFRRNFRGPNFEVLERRDMLSGTPTVTKIEVGSTAWSEAFVQSLNPSNPNAHGYAIPVGSSAQSATLTWDNIDQITITFSEDVIVDLQDLALSGVNTPQYHFAAFHYDPIAHTATWTLAAALDKDRLLIDLDADGADPVRDLEGNVLDGEWANNSSVVSGNGTAGGDFEFTFNVLPTDVNNTGNITSYDYVYIRQLDGKTTTSTGYIGKRDIDGNGVIDDSDWQKALDRVLQVLPTGSAAGTSNDAPTSSGFDLLEIDDDAVDVAISLLSGFDDSESGSSGMTYSIVSNSNSALFDSASINSSTNELVFNAADSASGRASIVVRATDAGGLSVDTTITVDVNYENQPPEIHNFSIGSVGFGLFLVSGDVTDADDDVSNCIVDFWNVFQIRSAVDANGHFEFAVEIPEGTFGIEYAKTRDAHGLESATHWNQIYIT